MFQRNEISDNIAKIEDLFKAEIIVCGKAVSLALLSELHDEDWNDRKARQRLKERLQMIFPELLFLSYNTNTPQIVIANINNISCTDFVWFIADESCNTKSDAVL